MTLPIFALVATIALMLAIIIACIIAAVTTIRSEWADRNLHLHNLTWPYRVVETMEGKFMVQRYVRRKKYFEWAEVNQYDSLDTAKDICIMYTAILMKNRYNTMTKEERERMRDYNNSVKQVVPIGHLTEQVCSYMKRSETLSDLDRNELDYITSKEFVTTHGDK